MDMASSFFGRRLKICWHVQTTREEEGDASSVFLKIGRNDPVFWKIPGLWVSMG